MRRTLAVLVLLWTFLAGGAADGAVFSDHETPNDEVLRTAVEFRRAVLQRDMPYLEKLLREGGGIDDHVLRFIYDDDYAKQYFGPKGRSVASILSSRPLGIIYEGAINTDREKYKGTAYIVYFYTPVSRRAINERVPHIVQRRKWMVDYVACQFERRGAEWFMIWSFCFDETDGPWR